MKTKDTATESELAKGLVSDDVPDTSLDAIKQLIPDTATPENQLADKDFVNGEISSVNSKVDSINSEVGTVKNEVSTVNSKVNTINGEINSINSEVSTVKSELGGKASVDQVILKETSGSQTIKSSGGGTDTPLILDTTYNGGCYIGFQRKGSYLGFLGVSNNKPSFWDTKSHDIMLSEDLYYEDYTFENPSWGPVGNVFYAGSLKTWTGDIRSKIISAQVVYWTGFYPWAILDQASPGSTVTSLALFSANSAQGRCIVRVWYKR